MATASFFQALTFVGASFWYVWLLLFIVCGIAAYYFFNFWINMKKYAEESTVEMQCSRPRIKKVLGRIIDGSGFEVSIPCSSGDNPALVDYKTTMVSPNLLSSANMGRKAVGTPVVNYAIPYIVPIPFRKAAALLQIQEHIRTNYPHLDWITEGFELMGLVFCPTNYLFEDCMQSVQDNIKYGNISLTDSVAELSEEDEYIEEDMDIDADIENVLPYKEKQISMRDKAQELYDGIIEIRKELNITRLKPTTVNLSEAADICNIGVTNGIVQEILVQQRRVDALNIINDFFSKNMPYLTVCIMCVAAVLVSAFAFDYLK